MDERRDRTEKKKFYSARGGYVVCKDADQTAPGGENCHREQVGRDVWVIPAERGTM